MTTFNGSTNESEILVRQLGDWKSVIEANSDILKKNSFLREFLGFKMDIAQNLIEELQSWEEIGNQSKCDRVSGDIQLFLGQIQVLIERAFSDAWEQALPVPDQEPLLIFSSSPSPECELRRPVKSLALAV
jgi:hypothetical protein